VKKVREDGFLREWLALGSFPGMPHILMTSPIINEEDICPNAADVSVGNPWVEIRTEDFNIDFFKTNPEWDFHAQCCCYTHIYVYSEKTQVAYLALGSDDGCVVWVNGQRIFALETVRGCYEDDNTVIVELQKGWNRVLFKVLQHEAGWAFCARFLTLENVPVEGLSYSVERPSDFCFVEPASSMPINISIQKPSYLSYEKLSANDSIVVVLLAQNYSQQDSSETMIEITTVDGASIKKVVCPVLAPMGMEQISLDISSSDWGLSRIRPLKLVVGRGEIKIDIYSDLVEAFLILSATGSRFTQQTDLKMLAQLRNDLKTGIDFVKGNQELQKLLNEFIHLCSKASVVELKRCLDSIDQIMQAEEKEMKALKISLVGHSHLDMNWLWRWPETVQSIQDSFRQAARFMKEFPDFRFVQSQSVCYETIEGEDPELFKEMQKQVALGAWNIVGGMWSEGDTNLSSGEAIARSFLLGQKYLIEKFNTRAKVGWLPDNFGHAAQLPQIMKLSGVDYFYHMRCSPGYPIYWWEALDGTRVLVKSETPYHTKIDFSIRYNAYNAPEFLKNEMVMYGVGDHGGGPTREEIHLAKALQESRLMPKIQFQSADEYFEEANEKIVNESPEIPTHVGELGYIFDGCYTSVASLKQYNRDIENTLQTAETLAVIAAQLGLQYPKEKLTEAWKILTLNQFHDILPGSAFHESNMDSRAKYQQALELAEFVKGRCLRFIAEKVNIDYEDTIPVLVFNQLSWNRDDVVIAEICVTHKFKSIKLFDNGVEIPVQIIKTKLLGCDEHFWIQFIAKNVPAVGYKIFNLEVIKGVPAFPILHWYNPYSAIVPFVKEAGAASGIIYDQNKATVSNKFFELAFDPEFGSITSIQMKEKDVLGANILGERGANNLGIYLEDKAKISGWVLDPEPIGPIPLEIKMATSVLQDGTQSVIWKNDFAYGRSKFSMITKVHADSPRIDIELDVEWLETISEEGRAPMLCGFSMVSGHVQKLMCDVPYGAIERDSGIEVPAQKWVDAFDGSNGLALLNNGRYGHMLQDGMIRMSMLRSFDGPDKYPDLGVHRICWSFVPHSGNWESAKINKEGVQFNLPMPTFQCRKQTGTFGEQNSFCSIESVNSKVDFVLTAVKQAEDGRGIVIRGYEAAGADGEIRLKTSQKISCATKINILEEKIADLDFSDFEIVQKVRAHEILTLKFEIFVE